MQIEYVRALRMGDLRDRHCVVGSLVLLGVVLLSSSLVWADCLAWAAQRTDIPKDASGLQGRLLLVDAPSNKDLKLYVTMGMRWCFIPLAEAALMCKVHETLPPSKTLTEDASRVLAALEQIHYVCVPVVGTAEE